MKGLLIVSAFIGVMGFIGWKLFYPTYSYRYRLTVEIDTPEGLKSGSGVIEVITRQIPRWITLGNRKDSVRVKGEATYLDLGGERNIFVILEHNANTLAAAVFLDEKHVAKYGWVATAKTFSAANFSPKEIPEHLIPTIVTFDDLNNPNTLIPVYLFDEGQQGEPSKTVDDFEQVFGTGYEFRRILIELTSARPEWIIKDILPWVSQKKGYLSYQSEYRKTKSITALSFRRGRL